MCAVATTVTNGKRGRPRGFDRDAALRAAMLLFWRHGYEGTSIAELTRAMGITPPSLYSAFGDKRALFEEVVRRYGQTDGAFMTRALDEEPTARAGVARMLREAAGQYTHPDHPWGCLVITAATNTTPQDAEVGEALRDLRLANLEALQKLIARDVQGDVLPPGTDAHRLAVFSAAVLQGMSQQARDGADAAELAAVADAAMRAWPD